MTAARQRRKTWLTAWVIIWVAGTGPAPGQPAGSPAAHSAATAPVVADWHTGLALSGYDPVAFFTDAKPLVGSEDIELRFGGAVWRFRNIGNRAAFLARPDVYMPRFGGHDPIAVARGVAVPGKPNLWLISGERLYLFHNRKALAAFADDPERVIAAADRKWPDMLRTLTP
jgi:hypothetical protein